MALWGRTRAGEAPKGMQIADPAVIADSVTAAAMPIDLTMPSSFQVFALGDRRWQREAQRHYDICGEYRFIAGWVASAVSRCRLYAADIDENGVPGDETDEEKARAIVDAMFGSPAAKAEAQRVMALNLGTTGEVFFGASGAKDGDPEADSWFTASISEVNRRGDQIFVRRRIKGRVTAQPQPLDPNGDILIRCWTPHPFRYDAADSAVRAILPKLRELEQATKQVFASIDSRLASAGLLLLPQSADFSTVPGQAPRQGDLQRLLIKAMSTALQDPASAAARVPIVVKVPDESIGKIQLVPFNFEITATVLDIREKAIIGIARSLDVPPEVLMGTGDVSHWSAWAVEESSIKLHVEPVLVRIADALNTGYFQPALKAAGVANPEKYIVWFDVTPLAIRPNRSDQAMQLNERGLISDEATRAANGFEETDKPKKQERILNLLTKLVLAQPLYAADPVVQKALGLPPGIQNPTAGAMPPGMPGAGGPAVDPNDPNADPEQLLAQLEAANANGGVNAPPEQDTGAPPPNTRTASMYVHIPPPRRGVEPLLVAADSLVRRALEVAGGRIVPGPGRDRYPDVPRYELHTRVTPTAEKLPALLAGAWTGVPAALALMPEYSSLAGPLARDLQDYAMALLEHGHAHTAELLHDYLANKRYPV